MIAAILATLLLAPARAQDLAPDATIAGLRAMPLFQAAGQVNAKLKAGAPPVSPSILAKLPARNSDRGRLADPLTVVFLGGAEQVQKALVGAGWTQVPMGIRPALEKGLEDTFWHRHRPPNLPFQTFYVNGKREDFNWAMARNLNTRHHFRLWRLPYRDDLGRELWWGSGDYDLRIRLRDLSHVVDPDVDAERLFIRDSLMRSPQVSAMWMTLLPQVKGEMVNNFGYKLRTDGNVLFVGLSQNP